MDHKKKNPNDPFNDNEIIFSQSVKAGRRVYYIDVKRDRKNEFFISLTESKRVMAAHDDAARPVFEKHKLFLYREDMAKFCRALEEAVNYVDEHAAHQYASDWNSVGADYLKRRHTELEEAEEEARTESDSEDMADFGSYRLGVDF